METNANGVLDFSSSSNRPYYQPPSSGNERTLDLQKKSQSHEPPPTQEQNQVISCDGNTIFVQAYAGTGKTTTLLHYTRCRPQKRFLYLSFNRSAKDFADCRFGSNVQCRTIDSLCFEIAGSRGKRIEVMLPMTLKKYREVLESDSRLSWKVYELLRLFLESPTFLSVSAAWMENQHIGGDAHNIATSIWEDVYAGRTNWTCHEFNRKIASLKDGGNLAKTWLEKNYDSMLVDECQDLNPIMLSILGNFSRQKIFVGDTHQAIYSFMGNVNAFERLRPTDRFDLTQSFRFGDIVASRADWIVVSLKNITRDPRQRIVPRNRIRGAGYPTVFAPLTESGERYTMLARVNKTLFFHAEHVVLNEQKSICWNGKDDFFNKIQQAMKIFVNPPAWNAKRKRAVEDGDTETVTMMDLIEEYEPEKLAALMQKIQTSMTTEDRADIVLSTVHKAKGLEWDHVVINEDVANSIIRAFTDEKFDLKTFTEECNIYYVAITRGKKIVQDDAFRSLKDLVE